MNKCFSPITLLLTSAFAWGTSCLATARDFLAPLPVSLPSVPRLDLVQATMPGQPRPTERRVRGTNDQRSLLRRFTLHRNDFAY